MLKKGFMLLTLLALISTALPSGAGAAEQPFTFGLLLVGPYNDHGWSQAHFDGGHVKVGIRLAIERTDNRGGVFASGCLQCDDR